MPNLDGGHYFLTVLAPIRSGAAEDQLTEASRSHRHLLAQALALLPTGCQTAASPIDAEPSPFARNRLNHLARFAIIDNPTYNGRLSGDTIVSAIRRTDPLKPQPVDRLNASYLLFAADIDARGDAEVGLEAYTKALWATMEHELRDVFSHCLGFDEVRDAEDFHRYIKRCQVETTMPFNDYWPDGIQVPGLGWRLWVPLICTVVALLALVVTGLVAAVGVYRVPGVVFALEVAFAALGALVSYEVVKRNGAKPFPTSPDSDLPSVLKALHLQQRFTAFAIDAQGLDDGALHEKFGAFLAAEAPDAPQPTQAPGVIRSSLVGSTT